MDFRYTLCLTIPFLLFIGCDKKEPPQKPLHVDKNVSITHIDKQAIHKALQEIDTNAYLENYIIDVINNGSKSGLGFSGGVMEGGFATKEDAPNIARYVLALSGKKSSNDTLGKNAQLFYTSNCGGCHGDDGKGLGGAFPDLTLQTFKGIAKKKSYLEAHQ